MDDQTLFLLWARCPTSHLSEVPATALLRCPLGTAVAREPKRPGVRAAGVEEV